MKYYRLHGSLTAKPQQGSQLAKILLQAAELLKNQSSCRLYLISRDESNPDQIWVTEAWENEQAHDDSLKDPAIRALIGQAMPLLDGMPTGGQKLTILGGIGID